MLNVVHDDPSLRDIRRTIMRDVLHWALPMTGLSAALAVVGSIVTGIAATQWTRGAVSLVLLLFSVASALALWRGRIEQAIRWLVGGLLTTVTLALTFNGGLRSPTVLLLVFLISLSGWLYGRRGATVMVAAAFGMVALFFGLGTAGLLPEPRPLSLLGYFTLLLILFALMWTTSAQPPERLHQALREAGVRERELKTEQESRLALATQFQAIFDQTSQLMCLMLPNGIVRSINRRALDFVGLASPESVVGRPFIEGPWWVKAARPLLAGDVAQAASGVSVHFETTHVNHRGEVRSVDFSLTPFRDQSGEVRYLIAEGRDITEVVQQRERVHSTRRLQLVGQLAGGVAHDFNNVLMVMLSSAEWMQADLEAAGHQSPEIRESLEAIISSGRRASDLTRRLLSFARRGVVARRSISVHALLESTCLLLQRTLPANLHLAREMGASEDQVDADLAELESALINLAVNARDAMPNGGTLTFSTENVVLEDAYCRASAFEVGPGPYLRLSVRDTGTGIAPEHLPRVFEPFFTTKEEGKGTGLGLASVYGVIREHGGALEVESTLGKGTTFHLTLPLSSKALAAPLPIDAKARFPGVRALVVDDEPGLRTMVPRLLAMMGIDCVSASSAEEALQKFDSSFHLLVTDIVLPGRRGNELAAELLRRSPGLAVVLMTGFPKDSDLSTLQGDRVVMLPKPFTRHDLQVRLVGLLRR
jgi:PAS domain S-box-containing protein